MSDDLNIRLEKGEKTTLRFNRPVSIEITTANGTKISAIINPGNDFSITRMEALEVNLFIDKLDPLRVVE